MRPTEEEMKTKMPPIQYAVMREGGTEYPFSGKFLKHDSKGNYVCGACGNLLFSSDSKFDSRCGWPAFDRFADEGSITTIEDTSHGMVRTEVKCAKCDSHLGHVFDDGPTETGLRYCINSIALDFEGDPEE